MWTVRGYRTASGIACVLIALAVTHSNGPEYFPVHVDNPERTFVGIPFGNHGVQYRITNSSTNAVNFLGGGGLCNPTCCFVVISPERALIGAGTHLEIFCKLHIGSPGPFEATIPIYFDDNGIREVLLTVRGIAVDSKEAARGSATPNP